MESMATAPLFEETRVFCSAFYDNNQATLSQLLSADCRMQNRYGKSARGVNGDVECINKLIVLRSKLGMLFPQGNGGSELFVEVMSPVQSCCLLVIWTSDRLKKLCVCFGLEWEANIVIGIVFRFNVDPNSYIKELYSRSDLDDPRPLTSWDMDASVVGAVLSSAELDEAAELAQEEFIFLHQAGGAGTMLQETTSNNPRASSSMPLRSSLKPLARLIVDEAVGSRHHVGFSKSLSVVLIPKVKYRPNDGIFYTHIDFKRFSAEAEEEIEEVIKTSKSSYMDKETAQFVLYQSEGTVLMTNLNVELKYEPEMGELDGGPTSPVGYPDSLRSISPRAPSITRESLSGGMGGRRSMSFDDDVDRDSMTRRSGSGIGLDDDFKAKDKGNSLGEDLSWFDRLYEIITSTIETEHAPAEKNSERPRLMKYLKTADGSSAEKSILPLGYSLGRILDVPPGTQREKHVLTIEVSVIGCNNLRSVLKRLFTRPVDSYVEIKINEQVQYTEIVNNEKNPLYDISSVYSFRVNPSEANLDNFITLTVYDKGLIDSSIIGRAVVSFAALKAQCNGADPTAIILPLVRHKEEMTGIGKGFYNSNNYYLTSSRGSASRGSVSRTSRDSQSKKPTKSSRDTPTISLAVSKIDPLTHGMLEALRRADLERDKHSSLKCNSIPDHDDWLM